MKDVVFLSIERNELEKLISDGVRKALGNTQQADLGKPMKLKDWAQLHGIEYGTAWKWAKMGTIEAKRLGSLWYVYSNNKIG